MTRNMTLSWVAGVTLLLVVGAFAGCSGSDGPTAPPDPLTNAAASSSGSTGSFGDTNQVAFASIVVEKATNGVDADFEPGPTLPVPSEVTWTYRVTNNGNENLENIAAVDDPEGVLTCDATSLAPQTSMNCGPLSGPAVEGQYANTVTITADTPSGNLVTASDSSHYLGVVGGVQIALDLEKQTNGEDADSPMGPILLATEGMEEEVTWTYIVTNNSDAEATDIEVSDDMELVEIVCPSTTLGSGEQMTCGPLTGLAEPDQYVNEGSLTAVVAETDVTVTDLSHYFGAVPEISLVKLTDGEENPELIPGCPVTWSYEVSNSGNVDLESLEILDNMEGAIGCPSPTLEAGDSMTCSHTGIVGDTPYENEATVSARYRVAEPNLVEAVDEDGYEIDGTPACEQIVASVSDLWPPNHSLVDVDLRDGICERTLDVRITGVTQDEPVNDTGDGNTEPDAFPVDDDTVQLRSERAGTGDGRVYLIQFRVFDAGGQETCTGEVRVDVPHDQGGSPALDSRPPAYDSFTGDELP